MSFGYFPDFKNRSPVKNWYLKIFGYPYAPRRNEVKLVFKYLNPRPGEKILDIGCGDGIFTNELVKRGLNVTGIDISEKDLKKALDDAEAVILAVPHEAYLNLDPDEVVKLIGHSAAIIDCFGILPDDKIKRYFELGCEVKGLGRGHIQRLKEVIPKR